MRSPLIQAFKSATVGAALLMLSAGISVALLPTIALAQSHGSGGGKGGHDEGDSCGGCEDGGSGGSGHRGGRGRAPGEASETHGSRSLDDIFRDDAGSERGPGNSSGTRGNHSSGAEMPGEDHDPDHRTTTGDNAPAGIQSTTKE